MDNGMIDLWDPSTWTALKTLAREEIRTDDKNTSRVEICTVCEFEYYPFFPLRVRSQSFDEAKYQLGGWSYRCIIVQHK